jgi:cyanobactin biosynthesis protein (PatB/AcyB/McaB family)
MNTPRNDTPRERLPGTVEKYGTTPWPAAPVKRSEIIRPHECVEAAYGAAPDLVRFRLYLIHGANFNDPPGWRFPSYETLKTSGRS